jgi:hypothetical protein
MRVNLLFRKETTLLIIGRGKVINFSACIVWPKINLQLLTEKFSHAGGKLLAQRKPIAYKDNLGIDVVYKINYSLPTNVI